MNRTLTGSASDWQAGAICHILVTSVWRGGNECANPPRWLNHARPAHWCRPTRTSSMPSSLARVWVPSHSPPSGFHFTPLHCPVFFPPHQEEKLLSALSTWLLLVLAQVVHFHSHQLVGWVPVMPMLMNFMPSFSNSSPAAVYALVIIAENEQLLHYWCSYLEELCLFCVWYFILLNNPVKTGYTVLYLN